MASRSPGHCQVDGLTLFVMRSLSLTTIQFSMAAGSSSTDWPMEWRQRQGVVEYRSQRGFAGEDMPRKPLDADGTTQASGSGVGSCREEERRPQRPSPRASRRRVRGVGQRPTVLGLAERSGKGFSRLCRGLFAVRICQAERGQGGALKRNRREKQEK